MPDPTTTENVFLVALKLSGGSSGNVEVAFTNARTGDIFRTKTINDEATVNLANTNQFPNGFQDGDKIDITGSGLKTGNKLVTVDMSKGGIRTTLAMTDVSTTNAPAVRV